MRLLRSLALVVPLAALLAGAGLVACAPRATLPALPAPVLDTRALMAHVVDPAADVFWGSSGRIVTAAGETSRAPTTQEGWDAAVHAAATLAEAGNLLMLPGRAPDTQAWAGYSRELQQAALAGMKAAQAKDEGAVFDTGGRIYTACRGCHLRYIPGFQ